MRRIRIVGLCTGLAVAAGLALAAGVSAALPELGRCVSHAGGQYANSNCTTLSTAPKTKLFEWEPGAVANGFTIKGAGVTISLERYEGRINGGESATCTASNGKGLYTSPTTIEITQLELVGCADKPAKVICQTEAAEGNSTEGKINIYALDGVLGRVSGTKAGMLLTGTVPNPFPFGKTPLVWHFECGGKLTGKGGNNYAENGIIGELVATDKMSLTSRFRLAKNKITLQQAIRHFEGEAEEHELFQWSFLSEIPEFGNITVVTTPTITNEEALEIKAR
jgi:hypothetical protein